MRIFRVLAVLFSALIAVKNVQAKPVITMVADEWLPFVGAHSDRGFMLDIADKVFQEHGIDVKFEEVPWTRALMMVKAGERDAAVGMQQAQAPDFAIPSEPLGMDEAVIFTRASGAEFKYDSPQSLEKMKLGVIKDYTYEVKLDEYIKTNLKQESRIYVAHGDAPYKSLVPMLNAGRLDAVVANPTVFAYQLKKMGIDVKVFKQSPVPGSALPVYIGFSPKIPRSREYAQMLGDGVAKLRKSGELAKILSKYGVSDWKK